MPLLINEILEHPEILPYLQKHHILPQYQKAKKYVLAGLFYNVVLKKREPKSEGVWYFRITKKYRALCLLKEHVLYVVDISDHQ